MRDSMREPGLPEPEFDQKEVGGSVVRVTLWNRFEERGIGGRKSVNGGRKSAESVESPVYYADHSSLSDEFSEQIPDLEKRGSKAKVIRAILVLCEWRPLRAEEIADYTHRTSAKKLVKSYLSPMVAKGFLQYTIPDNPSHKGQRYQTTGTGTGALLEGDVEL